MRYYVRINDMHIKSYCALEENQKESYLTPIMINDHLIDV